MFAKFRFICLFMFAKVDKNLDSCESLGINKVNVSFNWGIAKRASGDTLKFTRESCNNSRRYFYSVVSYKIISRRCV